MPDHQLSNLPPEVWGGIECSLNRIGDTYLVQDERSGHSTRIEDLDRFASLGISHLRYPILWEATAPDRLDRPDWQFADERLPRLRELGIEPIVTLVHHGAGPRYAPIDGPEFAPRLAEYARMVAERFPWINHWTPVNEPVTTARFSGLSGFWYPHGKDEATFLRVLVNQCRAIQLATAAIREVNPAAKFVQTEDLGKTYGTTAMWAKADFQNERRWLGIDLVSGRLGEDHALYGYLLENGITPEELEEMARSPSPPDVIGIDYYVRSERFLDDRTQRYPSQVVGEAPFADVDVARVAVEGITPVIELFREAWERYHIPMALTETHLGSTRDEEMRWLWELWLTACSARAEGAMDVRAVTVWALLGIYNWTSVLTVDDGQYEPGPFDLRAPSPRPTALAALTRRLASHQPVEFPVLESPGWWRRWERLRYPPVLLRSGEDYRGAPLGVQPTSLGRPILIAGAGGELAQAFIRLCIARGLAFRALFRHEMDAARPEHVERAIETFDPWAVINAAGMSDPDIAELEPDGASRSLLDAPATLAYVCAKHEIPLLTFSSDQVFGGKRRPSRAYVESDPTAPVSQYGILQAKAEERVLAAHEGALVIRTGTHFSPYEGRNVLSRGLTALARGEIFEVACEGVTTVTYVVDLVNDTLDLLIDGETGVWHHAHPEATTWEELMREACRIVGIDADGLRPVSLRQMNLPAARPRFNALTSERGVLPPPLSQALGRYCGDCQVGWATLVPEARRCKGAPIPTRIG